MVLNNIAELKKLSEELEDLARKKEKFDSIKNKTEDYILTNLDLSTFILNEDFRNGLKLLTDAFFEHYSLYLDEFIKKHIKQLNNL